MYNIFLLFIYHYRLQRQTIFQVKTFDYIITLFATFCDIPLNLAQRELRVKDICKITNNIEAQTEEEEEVELKVNRLIVFFP